MYPTLFPVATHRLAQVKLCLAAVASDDRTPEILLLETLKVVFGWDRGINELIKDELSRHANGSEAQVILTKWVGDIHAEHLCRASSLDRVTTADWMLFAFASVKNQKDHAVNFARRLVHHDSLHAAVILLDSVGMVDEAIELYASNEAWLEAVLLASLRRPNDWQKISSLVRLWAETSVSEGKAELAVRCFSCSGLTLSTTSMSTASKKTRHRSTQVLGSYPDEPRSAAPLMSRNSHPTTDAGQELASRTIPSQSAPKVDRNDQHHNFDKQSLTSLRAKMATPVTAIDTRHPSSFDGATARASRNRSRSAAPSGRHRTKEMLEDIEGSDSENFILRSAKFGEPQRVDSAFAEGSLDGRRAQKNGTRASFTEMPQEEKDAFELNAMKVRSESRTSSAPSKTSSKGRIRHDLRIETSSARASLRATPGVVDEVFTPGPATASSTRSMRSEKSAASSEYISSLAEARRLAAERRAKSRNSNFEPQYDEIPSAQETADGEISFRTLPWPSAQDQSAGLSPVYSHKSMSTRSMRSMDSIMEENGEDASLQNRGRSELTTPGPFQLQPVAYKARDKSSTGRDGRKRESSASRKSADAPPLAMLPLSIENLEAHREATARNPTANSQDRNPEDVSSRVRHTLNMPLTLSRDRFPTPKALYAPRERLAQSRDD